MNGEYVIIEEIQHEILESPITVYNFRVSNDHTYFVGNVAIGVHNAASGYGESGSPKVEYNGEGREVFRAGNDFEIKPGEVKIDKATGNVKTNRGVSINVDSAKMQKLANMKGLGNAYRIDSLPEGLKIIQQGNDPGHFEIVPEYPMPLEAFQSLLNQISTSEVGK